MTFKMSDRYDSLPIEWYTGEDDYAAKIGINAYDGNQERIDELGKVIARLNKEVKEGSHWKANHDEVVKSLRGYTCRPDLTIVKQQREIADLKAALLEIAHLPSVRMDEGSYIAHKALGKAND